LDNDEPFSITSKPALATVSTSTTAASASHPAASNTIGNSSNRPANPRLTSERLNRLESIGFEWKVKNKMKRYYDKQWEGMFQNLLDFKKKYGHCNVPKRFPENARLGTWVHTQ
jgi:Helicase associated domain